MLVYLVVVNFLSGFFFANSLWIKPKSWINKYRLFAAFAAGFLAFAEGFLDVDTYGTSVRKKLEIRALSFSKDKNKEYISKLYDDIG